VEGQFEAGSVVSVNSQAKAVTSLSSVELRSFAGKHSSEIKKALGPGHKDVVATPEDIVFLDY
jgi:glutamate 5-kinase